LLTILQQFLFGIEITLTLHRMAGIYIHIPFCKQKCSYCDFHFSTTYHAYREKMILSICKEIKLRSKELNEPIETIYFGGGTPSLLLENELFLLLSTIKTSFEVKDHLEITLESNPDDLTFEKLIEFKSVGINRLSIGLQSFRSEDLEWMNRAHTAEESLNCIPLAQKAGFNNISIDLIYGLPNLTISEWENMIDIAIQLDVQHISAYCLTVEGKTALKKWVDSKLISISNEDEQSDQFELLVQKLKNAGINQYEISNFSKPNFESKHNSSYWKGIHYIGIGPSAHSFNGKSRSWNVSNNRSYIKALENDEKWFEIEILSIENQFNELILTGLRTIYGLNLDKLKEICEPPKTFWNTLNRFIDSNWVIQEKNYIYLSEEGKLKADHIASELFI
jgi:oxygen-independent coproporphyrinogen-3 oxidase